MHILFNPGPHYIFTLVSIFKVARLWSKNRVRRLWGISLHSIDQSTIEYRESAQALRHILVLNQSINDWITWECAGFETCPRTRFWKKDGAVVANQASKCNYRSVDPIITWPMVTDTVEWATGQHFHQQIVIGKRPPVGVRPTPWSIKFKTHFTQNVKSNEKSDLLSLFLMDLILQNFFFFFKKGIPTIFGIALGVVGGGLLIKRFQLHPRHVCLMLVISAVLLCVVLLINIALGCERTEVCVRRRKKEETDQRISTLILDISNPLIDRLIDWLVDLFFYSFIYSFIYLSIDWLIDRSTDDWMIDWLIDYIEFRFGVI